MPDVSSWRLDQFQGLGPQQVLLFAIALGIIYTFLGYRVFRFILALTGFLIAGGVAAAISGWLIQGNVLAMAILGAIGGLCGAFALYFLYRTGVFFLGGTAAGLIAFNLIGERPEAWIPLAIVGCGLAGGLVALLLERPAMTVATAAIGAYLTVVAGAMLVVGRDFETRLAEGQWSQTTMWTVIGVWVALALVGTAFQFRITRDRPAAARAVA